MGGLRASSSAAAVIVAIVVVPSLVGEVSAPDEAEAPKPIEASIKTMVEGDELVDSDSALLRIRAKGNPPAAGVLASGSGLGAVDVREATVADCEGLPEHRVAAADARSQWCLELEGIGAGDQVEGKLNAPGTILSLTVSRRVPFFPGPFLVVFAGLLLGGLVGLLPGLFRERARRGLIDSTLAENDAAVPAAQVASMGEWVKARLAAGESASDLMPVVREVCRKGPANARAARAALADRLGRSTLEPDHAFVEAATLEAEKQTHERKDFLEDDGTRRGHPAYEWIAAIAELERQKKELIALAGAIAALPEPPQRVKPEEKLAEANAAFGSADKPGKVAAVDSRISAVQEAIVREQQGMEAPAEGLRMLVLGGYAERFDLGPLAYRAGPAGVGAEPPPSTPADAVDRAKLKLAPWKVVTAAFIVLVAAWAFLSIQQTVYAPKEAFGSWPDYFALLTSAVGSGAAGAVIALVGIWFPLLQSSDE